MDGQKKSILLVEDEMILGMLSKQLLEKEGYSVVIATSGEKAIDHICTKKEPVDLILMDIDLGKGIDGTETAQFILGFIDIPLLFLSSHTEKDIVAKTEKITNYGYVVKNSSFTVLDASIKMAFKLFDAKRTAKEQENAAHRSEAKYRHISEYASDGIVHFSAEGKIDYVSPAYLKQLGYTELAELGNDSNTIAPQIHPDDRDVLFSSLYREIDQKKKEFTYSYRIKHAKGHYIWREDHSCFIYDTTGTYLGAYVSCRDVTDQKSIENKLVVLGHAIEEGPAIIVVTDLDGKIEYVNSKFTMITGYSSEESTGKNPRFLQSGKTDTNVYSDLWNTLAAGNEWKGYFRNKKKCGEIYYESATIRPIKNMNDEITHYLAIKSELSDTQYMQESMDESKIRFNTLAGSQSILLWEAGLDKLCYYFNSAWLSYTGRKIEDEIGNGWTEGVHPDDFDRCLKIYSEAFDARKEFSMEYRLRKANGEYGWLLDNGSPKYHNNEFIGYLGSCTEITERKNYENILRVSEEKYRLLHESAGIGIAYYTPEGIVLSYNKLAARHMGGNPEDFIGKSIFSLFPKADANRYFERIRKATSDESSTVYEDKVQLPIGDIYFLSTFTRINSQNEDLLGIQIISQDITNLKNMEIKLQQSNEDYEVVNEELKSTTEELQAQNEELIQSQELLRQDESRLIQAEDVAKIGNWTLELATKTIIASNGADTIYGVDFKRVPLAEVQKLPLLEYRPILDKALSDLVINNTPYDIKFKILRSSDKKLIDIHSVATFDKNTNTIFGVIQDITEQMQAENKIVSLLAEKELILKEVHHRIKNNMHSMGSLLRLRSSEANPETSSILNDAAGRIQSMTTLYDKLYQSEDFGKISLKEYLPSLINDVVKIFPLSVKIDTQIEEIILGVKMLSPLGIIINELITNSMKYAFLGRTDGLITIKASNKNNLVSLIYQDNGVGIPESITFVNSTGFGMQLVNGLVNQIKGSIRIERKNGTMFVIEFET